MGKKTNFSRIDADGEFFLPLDKTRIIYQKQRENVIRKSKMSASSSSSDSEGSSTGDEMPKVTTHTERVIRRYQIKKSLILERMFAIEQDNENLVRRIIEVEGLVQEGLCHRKSIMNRLDSYGDAYRSVPVLIPSEAEAASSVRGSATPAGSSATSASQSEKKTPSNPGKKRKLNNAENSTENPSTPNNENSNEAKRTPRDPSLPKRPHNAFFYFSQERRPAMQKEFPTLTKKEIAALLSQKWAELPPNEKAMYIHLQNERKKQYQEIMQQYNENRAEMMQSSMM